MGVTVLIPNGMIEPLVTNLDHWIKWLRPGTMSQKIGAIKGALMPMAQSVFYDREALMDDHCLWDVKGEGEGESRSRKVEQTRNAQGVLVREEVIFKDSKKFTEAMRNFLVTEQPVEIPHFLEMKWFAEQANQLVKDQMGLTPPDFGPMRYIIEGQAKLYPAS